ncbi:MAG TPA: hypothetical protein VFE24_02690 [Pirellulales bacterium]|jgi:hypothetical protein|nr:hypothetical protein [Pirellulales bacterium]
MFSRPTPSPLVQFFSGLAEYAFQTRLGVVDPPLVDYIVDLLVRFVQLDAVFQIRDLAGRSIQEVAAMRIEAEARQGDARRLIHRHIGDFALFWSGVYPEALHRLQHRNRMDHLLDYWAQGKQAYHIAASIPTSTPDVENDLLERLSHDFELCAYGLGEIRREWERRDEQGDGPIQPIVIA